MGKYRIVSETLYKLDRNISKTLILKYVAMETSTHIHIGKEVEINAKYN